jgi:site-specific DNA-cytosine methylase
VTVWLKIDTSGSWRGAKAVINLDTEPAPAVNCGALGPGNQQCHYWIEDDGVPLILNRTPASKYSPGGNVNAWRPRIDIDREPSPAVLAGGISPHNFPSEHWLTLEGGDTFVPDPKKPPYRVPTMREIARVPWNGFTVATTFAGAGGSSLGYRMAGYRVAWANEFVPIAADCYEGNARDGTVVDRRDIREVQAEDILKATGLSVGELDVLDGSPPCQAFSMAGRREKGWGTERAYAHGAKQKNEDLFFEYVRLVKGLKPRVFVAENVAGLVRGVAKGYFINILGQLKACGYRVRAQVLDAQWLGVPQQRERVIFVGVREDLALEPAFPKPWRFRYSVRDAIPWIVGASRDDRGAFGNGGPISDIPAPAVLAGSVGTHWAEDGSAVELVGNKNAPLSRKGKRHSVEGPAPTVLSRRVNFGVEDQRPGVLVQGPEVDQRNKGRPIDADAPAPAVVGGDARKRTPRQFEVAVVHDTGRKGQRARNVIDEPCPAITSGPNDANDGGGPRNHFKIVGVGANDGFGKSTFQSPDLPAKTIGTSASSGNGRAGSGVVLVETRHGPRSVDRPAPTVVKHGDAKTRSEMTLSTFKGKRSADQPAPTIQTHGRAATRNELMVEQGADISGFAIGDEWDGLPPGGSTFYGGRLYKPDAEKPCPTVVATGGTASAASVTHPVEKRKFSIAELKRICAFPDDFKLIGTYAQQWERLGNSVPPLMMRAVAEVLRDEVLRPAAGKKAAARPRARAPAKNAARRPGSSGGSTKGSPRKGAGTSRSAKRASRPKSAAASRRGRTRSRPPRREERPSAG